MQNFKVPVRENSEGLAVINAVNTSIEITFNSDSVRINEAAEISAGLENPVVIRRDQIYYSGSDLAAMAQTTAENNQAKDLTTQFVADVAALYTTYRQAISAVRTSINPNEF